MLSLSRPVARLLRPLTRSLLTITDYGLRDSDRELLHIETRNLCRCEECYGRHSHQKKLGDIRAGVKITEIGRVSEHYVSLKWSDGHEGMLPRTLRGAFGAEPVPTLLEKYYSLSLRRNECQTFWDKANNDVMREFKFEDLSGNDENIREFLAHFMRFGLAFVADAPKDADMVTIMEEDLQCRPIWNNIFGLVDTVMFRHGPKNAAYGSNPLPGHTDLSFYTHHPSTFIFHCQINTAEGGESFWLDTFSAMEEVRRTRPDHFESLVNIPMFYRYSPPQTSHLASSAPTVVLQGDNIISVRDHMFCFDEFEFAKYTERSVRSKWWDAYLYYRNIIESPARRAMKLLRQGDVVLIDNWRVLHGRDEFRAGNEDTERVMKVGYIDWSHLQNKLLGYSGEIDTRLELGLH